MGKAMLLIVAGVGLTISSGVVNQQKRIQSQNEMVVDQYEQIATRNLATSGMNLALSQITRDNDWRDGYSRTFGADGSFSVSVNDMDSLVRITSTGYLSDYLNNVVVDLRLTNEAGSYAIYSTGDVDNVIPLDQHRNVDSTLLIQNAESMPSLDLVPLINLAVSQGHFYGDPSVSFIPNDGYPNWNFYYNGTDPNVTYVRGKMKIYGGRRVYGIFLVEKDIIIYGNARVEGVLYLLNPDSKVYYDLSLLNGGGSPDESSVVGGILANGKISGKGNHISVQYNPEYMELFGSIGQSRRLVKILSWKD